jgi:hypothetical protein
VFRGAATTAIAHGLSRVPGLKRLPVLKLLAIGEIVLLARTHVTKLTAEERRRLVSLVREGRGRPSRLSDSERDELQRLVAKAEPRIFAGEVADKLSPVPLPRRLRQGPRKKVAPPQE